MLFNEGLASLISQKQAAKDVCTQIVLQTMQKHSETRQAEYFQVTIA